MIALGVYGITDPAGEADLGQVRIVSRHRSEADWSETLSCVMEVGSSLAAGTEIKLLQPGREPIRALAFRVISELSLIDITTSEYWATHGREKYMPGRVSTEMELLLIDE